MDVQDFPDFPADAGAFPVATWGPSAGKGGLGLAVRRWRHVFRPGPINRARSLVITL